MERIDSTAARVVLAGAGAVLCLAWLTVPHMPFTSAGGVSITLSQAGQLCGSWLGALASGCGRVEGLITALTFALWAGLALLAVGISGRWPWPSR